MDCVSQALLPFGQLEMLSEVAPRLVSKHSDFQSMW